MMIFYHPAVVVVGRGYGQRALYAYVLFQFVIPTLIWLNGVPVIIELWCNHERRRCKFVDTQLVHILFRQ